MPDLVTITNVRCFITAPGGHNLIVVRIDTSDPGLYGIGCATFRQRAYAVKVAVDDYLAPLLLGRDVANIEDLYKLCWVNSYWRNGPVLNNAISGVDQALWDIKGKRAGMPVYDLLGGKMRPAAATYRHADGKSPEAVADKVLEFMEAGQRHVRIQFGGYGGRTAPEARPEGTFAGEYFDPSAYARSIPKLFETVRTRAGDGVELIHDIHERLPPCDAIWLAKALEPYRLFFLEDALSPEDLGWFRNLRATCTTPLAMGELFVHPAEWLPLVQERLIDFIRMHISDLGGLTPARKAATVAELNGVRTAWHGPGDVSPIGHMCNLHLDLASPNFGIQEFAGLRDAELEVFPGCPELRRGYLYANDRPGWGMEFDEEKAARFPGKLEVDTWTQARTPDGSLSKP